MVQPIIQQGAPAKQPMSSRDVVSVVLAGALLLGGLVVWGYFDGLTFFEDALWYLGQNDPWFLFDFLALISPLAIATSIVFIVFREYFLAALFLIPAAFKWAAFQVVWVDIQGFEALLEGIPIVSLILYPNFEGPGFELAAYLIQDHVEPLGLIALGFLLLARRPADAPAPADRSPSRAPLASRLAVSFAFFFPLVGLVIGYVARQDLRRQNPGADTSMATAAIVSSWIALAVFTLLAMYLVLES